MQRRRSTSLALLLVVLVGSLGLLVGAGPAAAARTITIVINEGGTTNPSTAVTAGDRVVFKNSAKMAGFAVNGPAFATGLIAAGATSRPSAALPVGTYDYTIQVGGVVPSGFGRVVVSAVGAPSPTPTRPTTPVAPPTTKPPTTSNPVVPGAPVTPGGPSIGPSLGAPVPGGGATPQPPVQTGGNGFALQPRLDTGSLLLPPADGSVGGVAPELAPGGVLLGPGYEDQGFQYDPSQGITGGTLGGGPTQPQALTERLNDPDALRTFGLPAILGLVLLAGAGSLVVRVLLATTTLRAWLRGRSPLTRTA